MDNALENLNRMFNENVELGISQILNILQADSTTTQTKINTATKNQFILEWAYKEGFVSDSEYTEFLRYKQ